MTKRLAMAALASVIISAAAVQTTTAATPPNVVDLQKWDTSTLATGWSAEALLGDDVYGPDGNEIGEIEDILVGSDNQIEAVIVETEAFLDVGDVHARVDWNKVSKGPEDDSVTIPLTQDTLDESRIDYDSEAMPRTWRVREFIGDVVGLEDRPNYGVVDDVIFSDGGDILAVIASPNYGYGVGRQVYPYYGYGYGWDPGYGYYNLPYTRAQVGQYGPYDRGQIGGPFE